MNTPNTPSPRTTVALQSFEPSQSDVYPIETVVRLTHLSRYMIAVYCRYGVVTPVSEPQDRGWVFDAKTITTLRRMETLHTEYGLTMAGVRMLAGLLHELEELREEKRQREELVPR
jgi:DNA-binding transcriptional MerR regulator